MIIKKSLILIIQYFVKLYKRIISKYYQASVYNTARKVVGPIFVHGPSNVNRYTELGRNINFNGLRSYGSGEIYIGDNFHSGPECILITSFHNYDRGNAIPYDETSIQKKIVIGDNVWLGTRVIVLGGVTIGEGAIIQAGSVVVTDIPPLGIAGGHPAKVFNYRDKEHYFGLKEEGKYL